MSNVQKRCRNCRVLYLFQESGHGCLDEPNYDRYCPTCWDVALRAMEEIPVKTTPVDEVPEVVE